MSKQLVSRSDFNNYKNEVIKTYATKSEIQAANYGTKGDLAAYALKTDLDEYQVKGDYALKSDLDKYQLKGDSGLTREDIINLIKSTIESQDELVMKGNIVMRHPNGDEWIIGMRDQNHFAINKLDKTGTDRGSGSGFLIRNDGHVWASGGGFHRGPIEDEGWYRSWQHNIHMGRR